MKEEFLHFVWKNGLYNSDKLSDIDGNPIKVIHPGEYNHDSGPDFFNSRLIINGTEWAGNVEIHLKASHFEAHGHHRDHSFDNVILHVVYEKDKLVRNARGQEVLTVALEIDDEVHEKYSSLVNNPAAIACQDVIGTIDRFYIQHWIQSLMVERLSVKAEAIARIFTETGNDWEETFYRVVSRYFGFRVNTEPFEMLARALPFRIIKKHADNLFQVEALLFGTAGMLEEGLFRNAINDDYYLDLLKEYRVLSAKYSLQPVHGWLWKFSRLRPVNFPTVRLSQLAAMLCVAGGLFSRVIESKKIYEMRSYFEVSASRYWDDHFVFGKRSGRIPKKTGDTATAILLINSVIPVVFCYGRMRNEYEHSERALSFLDEIDPEENVIIEEWGRMGITPVSASDTQALIQLKNEYCRKRRCLDCRIGARLIAAGRRLKDPEELILEP
jgi:hypothetical protein